MCTLNAKLEGQKAVEEGQIDVLELVGRQPGLALRHTANVT